MKYKHSPDAILLYCSYVKWLEANGLSDSVPRMEAHYLNPSPWAEKERYEIEFNDIQREVNIES